MGMVGLIVTIGLWLFVDVYLAIRMKRIYNGNQKRWAKVGLYTANVVLGSATILVDISL